VSKFGSKVYSNSTNTGGRAATTKVDAVGNSSPSFGHRSQGVPPQPGGGGRAPATDVTAGGKTGHTKKETASSGGAQTVPVNVTGVRPAKAPDAKNPACGRASSGRGPKMDIKKA
jgi:hypothetical protein